MANQSLLTFTLHGLVLAIDARVVREIIWLPELTLVEECPGYIAGVVDMHGKIVPMVDLNSRFGHPPQKYHCSDRVIILGVAGGEAEAPGSQADFPYTPAAINLFGIIVNEVLDLLDLPGESIEPPLLAGKELRSPSCFLCGQAKSGNGIVMIVDPRKILEPEFLNADGELDEPERIPQAKAGYFCPEASAEERNLFRDRAVAQRQAATDLDSVKSIAVAVVRLSGESLCLELEAVREFAKIHNITPVPCCPEHVVGNMNLRGNVLTVVDIRGLLNMECGKLGESTKVVVADLGEFAVGFIVDEIVDVIHLRETEIVAVPASIKGLSEKFVKGAVPFAGRIAALLDLPAILAWEGLVVNEEV